MTVWWLLVAVFAVSWVLTLILRRYALAKSLMDIPNERSSHSVPTPRGGGVAIVVAFLLALPALAGMNLLSPAALYGLFGSGLLVAVIGFADDHGHIAARWRLLGHFIAAAWALFWLQGLEPIQFLGATVDLGWFGNILAAFFLVWMLNLYNFMDGIDGLASVQAIFVCAAACLISWLSGHYALIWAPLLLSAAVTGFLLWNFPPARIFMGDAGSGFLGLILATLTLSAGGQAPELMWSWLILLGIFIVDATVTLFRRLSRREKIYQAHRSHAYQHASRYYSSHRTVTLGTLCINLLWMLPIALAVGIGRMDGFIGLVVAYTPLIWLAVKFNAGVREQA
ncbi:MraY family glycosyltransferase [Pseudomonas sp. BS3782 TE3695]|jgi:Fuc2NAc and GlcNAc transferase|uniref:MraY family glycosyltransferase n=1 Tax=Pseudomonas sp. BS3782 TE3695 TaxID=3349323 RepID=UPI003D1F70AE